MVIHGPIDGHSRIIVYLHSSSNNTVETVLSLFTEAVVVLSVYVEIEELKTLK